MPGTQARRSAGTGPQCGGRQTRTAPTAALVTAVLVALVSADAQEHREPTHEVLLLNSYHQGYAWTDDCVAAVSRVLTAALPHLEIHVEYMDAKRLVGEEWLDLVYRTLRLKYAHLPLDLIIASDDDALQFLLRYHAELFPGVPVVFCGINNLDEAALAGRDAFTGLISKLDVEATITLACRLHPQCRRVAVISDGTSTGLGQRREVQAVAPRLPHLTFEYLNGEELSADELLARLRTLGPESVVLVTVWLRDRTGTYIPCREGYPAISANSPVPVYGLADLWLGLGIVGGKLSGGALQGEQAARIALQILKEGKSPAAIPVQRESPNRYMFDYAQLVRFGIREADLPAGSIVLHKPFSFYAHYRLQIWAVALIVLLLAATVVALAGNILLRRRTEAEQRARLERSQRQQRAIVALATRESVATAEFAPACRAITEAAAEALGVERVGVWLLDADGRKLRCVELYERTPRRHSAGLVLDSAAYPEYFAALRSERALDAHEARRDPRTACFRSVYLLPYGITSMLDAPVRLAGRLVGVICHEHVGPARRWQPDEVAFAGEMADQVAQALLHADRRRAEAERDRLFSLSIDMLCIAGFDGYLKQVNPAWSRTLGWDQAELLRRPWIELVHRDDQAATQAAVQRLRAGETVLAFENRCQCRDGSYRWLSWNALPVPQEQLIFCVARDITEKLALEAQLRQAQKLEAVGQLAGGVAHDFNNILTAILGNVDLTVREIQAVYPGGGPAIDGMRQIERSALRASRLTRQLLAFSRRQLSQPQVLDLNRTLAEMEKMLQRLLTEDIRLTLDLAPDLKSVRADPGQIEQIVMNLVVNARDAMPHGGTVRIWTANVVLDDGHAAAHAGAQPGPHVLLAVSDTGCGMDARTLEHIFEPFFTTKPPGQGTGLGLSTVYGLVKQAGGHVTVSSAPGRGTTFRIHLPALDAPAWSPSAAPPDDEAPGGTETILLCEDDEAVRQLAVQILAGAGYTVLATGCGDEALRLAAERNHGIDLLITDVILPDTNGRRLADALTAQSPQIKTLFISGHTSEVIAHHGVLDEGIEFLEKPFARRALLQRVRQVLDGARQS